VPLGEAQTSLGLESLLRLRFLKKTAWQYPRYAQKLLVENFEGKRKEGRLKRTNGENIGETVAKER